MMVYVDLGHGEDILPADHLHAGLDVMNAGQRLGRPELSTANYFYNREDQRTLTGI